MRLRLNILGLEVIDFATGADVLATYPGAEDDDDPRIPAVYGHASGADTTRPDRTFGFATADDEPRIYE